MLDPTRPLRGPPSPDGSNGAPIGRSDATSGKTESARRSKCRVWGFQVAEAFLADIVGPTDAWVREALSAANRTVPALRAGLNRQSAPRAAEALRSLLHVPGVVVAGPDGPVGAAGVDQEHVALLADALGATRAADRALRLPPSALDCTRRAGCALQVAAVVPLHLDGLAVGALATLDIADSTRLLQLTAQGAALVECGLELSELDTLRARAAQARELLVGFGEPAPISPVDGWGSVAVELGGRTVIVHRAEVSWVESAGDYVRLHGTGAEASLVRIPLGLLEQRWAPHGFARIHRSYLVALRSIRELRTDGPQAVVSLGDAELPVSRRHLRELRERLAGHGPRGW
jgi:DNA-binding LytR/AlgR family response regulator